MPKSSDDSSIIRKLSDDSSTANTKVTEDVEAIGHLEELRSEAVILSMILATASDNFGVAPFREPPAEHLVGKGTFITDGTDWARSRGVLKPCFARSQLADLARM
ncbi:MAG: hypothetical protein Q9214_000225 [Letrouitia sp. 1 TL-2023]